MSTFVPRALRVDLSFPLTFLPEGERAVSGHCLNISASGLMANLDTPLELWTRGGLTLDAGIRLLSIQVRVARVQGREAGLAFSFHTDAERAAVDEIVAYATRNTALAGGRPPF